MATTITKNSWLALALCFFVGDGASIHAEHADNCVVRTLVGSPVTSAGDGGSAAAALLFGASGLASDSAGDVYIADTNNNRIRLVTPDGVISTVAGIGSRSFIGDGGPASTAALNQPSFLALAPDGTLFVSDTYNNRVRRITPDGNIDTVAGTGAAGFNGDEVPAVDAQLFNPGALVHDGTNLYIADQNNYRVRAVDPSGIIHTVAGTGVTSCPVAVFGPALPDDGVPATETQLCSFAVSLAVDSRRQLYVGQSRSVFKILPDGTVQYVVGPRDSRQVPNLGAATDGVPALSVAPNAPAIAIGPSDTLYLSGISLDTSPVITSTGIYVPSVWTVDANGLLQHFSSMSASGLAFSPAGLLVATGDQVFAVNQEGVTTLVAGQGIRGFSGDGGLGTLAKISTPRGLAIGADGDLYISDSSNSRIRRLAPDGTITTVAGGGNAVSSADGGLATAAGLSVPTDLALDTAGNLYVLEYLRDVRKIDSSGTITPYAGNGTGRPNLGLTVFDNQPANIFSLAPDGMAIGPDGTLFLGEAAQNVIWTVTPDDIAHLFVDKGDHTADLGPIVVDPEGNLIWDAVWARGFVQISPDGSSQPLPGLTRSLGGANGATVLAFDSQGVLYGNTTVKDGGIVRVGKDGATSVIIGAAAGGGTYDDGPPANTLTGNVTAITVDAQGNLYFADGFTSRVRMAPAGCLSPPSGR